MTKRRLKPAGTPGLLGIECGATRSVALFVQGGATRRREGGPANLKLCTDAQLVEHLRGLKPVQARGAVPAAVAIGMAGARTAEDHARIVRAAGQVWPGVPCRAASDLETGLTAADAPRQTGSRGKAPDLTRQAAEGSAGIPRVLVLSGTGSCCFGRTPNGRTVRFGGWGHLLGDRGSGYQMGLQALQRLVMEADRGGRWPSLGGRILRSLQLNTPEELVDWAQAASKNEMGALAVDVFEAATRGDRLAKEVLRSAAQSLASDAAGCARLLIPRGRLVQFVLAGSVLLKQPRFARTVARLIRLAWPCSEIGLLKREGAWGAVELARALAGAPRFPSPALKPGSGTGETTQADLASLNQSPTEQRHPRSMNLDKLPLRQAIELMLSEDAKIPAAILQERHRIERAVRLIVRSFRRGGRLFYVGAGTSGRLGVLDASECPPTFGTPPDLVQGIMAGGQAALWSSVEGAEDFAAAGAQAVACRTVTRRDTVVGIAASGRTPFVWGALDEARRRGAATVLLCFNPFLRIPRGQQPTVVIAPNVGPEVLTGSTRLKAGTATKLILNLFTTLAMVRMGRVIGNLMVDLNPSNAKLRNRAIGMVRELTGASEGRARSALEEAGWSVKAALGQIKRSAGETPTQRRAQHR